MDDARNGDVHAQLLGGGVAEKGDGDMARIVIIVGLVVALLASLAGFPFEVMEAHAWAGTSFVIWALGLFTAAALLSIRTARAEQDLAAVGFAAVALYAMGTALNSSLLARGLAEASVGIQPGIWALLALGLALVALTAAFPGWVRVVGALAALGHATAATALLFGAEMPHTGAEATDWPPLVVAASKVLLWVTMIGWVTNLRRDTTEPPPTDPRPRSPKITTTSR